MNDKEFIKYVVNNFNCMICGEPLHKRNIAFEIEFDGMIRFVRHSTCKPKKEKRK